MLLEAMIVDLFYRIHIIFRLTTIFYNMYMNRLMVIRIKHKPESKKYEYRWHIISFLMRFKCK